MSYLEKPWLKSYKLGPYKLEHSLKPYPGRAPVQCLGPWLPRNMQTEQLFSLWVARSPMGSLKTMRTGWPMRLVKLGVEKGDKVCVFPAQLPGSCHCRLGNYKGRGGCHSHKYTEDR